MDPIVESHYCARQRGSMRIGISLAFARMPRAPVLRSSATAEGGEARGASLFAVFFEIKISLRWYYLDSQNSSYIGSRLGSGRKKGYMTKQRF